LIIMKKHIAMALLLGTTITSLAVAQESASQGQSQPRAQTQMKTPAQAKTPAQTKDGQAETPAFKKLTRAEFDALLKTPGKALVLDVRRPDEVQSIGGFPVYLSIQSADLEKYLAFIPRDRTIVTVSNHAGRAGKAVALLEKNGFTVAGGIGAQDYEAEGGSLVKIVPPAPKTSAGTASR
jgi:rhodanese-related sulfurtransferase